VPARIAALLRARLRMAGRSGSLIPALLFHAVLGTALALLVRGTLPPFPYALFALALGSLLLALPLLSDLGALLRVDEAGEWVAALPALPAERTLARVLHLLIVLGALALAWFVPWAVFAPAFTWTARLALPLLGFALALLLASVLVWLQQLLLARFQGAFVALETVLVVGVVVALVQLLGHLPEVATLTRDDARLAWLPPAWYARALGGHEGGVRASAWLAPLAGTLVALGALLAVPASPAEGGGGRRRSTLERVLGPLRALALRAWVRPDERGPFGLVFAALPREREVALRTYPMLGIPLAFLVLGVVGDAGSTARADGLALLLFTAGVYLPLLLTHVPLSESAEAAWILRTAPVPASTVRAGAIKALFVRWILPLYLALLVLGLALGQAELLARLWLPALLLALLVLRIAYRKCVNALPLSVAPAELAAEVDWAGQVTALAVGLTLLAVLANRFGSWPLGLAGAGLLALLEWRLEASAAHRRDGEEPRSRAD
jgi:hypothetical protein